MDSVEKARTKCDCTIKCGMCPRHGVYKTEEMVKACRDNPQAFSVWENRIGPGQLNLPYRDADQEQDQFAAGYPCVARSVAPIDTISCGFCGDDSVQVAVPLHYCQTFNSACSVLPAGDKTRQHTAIRSCSRCSRIAGDIHIPVTSSQSPVVAACIAKALVNQFVKNVKEKMGPPYDQRKILVTVRVDQSPRTLAMHELMGPALNDDMMVFNTAKGYSLPEWENEIKVYGLNPGVAEPEADTHWFNALFIAISEEFKSSVGADYAGLVSLAEGAPLITPCIGVESPDVIMSNNFVRQIASLASDDGSGEGPVFAVDRRFISSASAHLASILAGVVMESRNPGSMCVSSPCAAIAFCGLLDSGIETLYFKGSENNLRFIRLVVFGSEDATKRPDGIKCPDIQRID